jgi:hypothetical protein
MATMVALLILNFVDEQFNDARFTRAAKACFWKSQPHSGSNALERLLLRSGINPQPRFQA